MSPLSLKSRQSLDQVHTLPHVAAPKSTLPFHLDPTKRRTGTAFCISSRSLTSPTANQFVTACKSDAPTTSGPLSPQSHPQAIQSSQPVAVAVAVAALSMPWPRTLHLHMTCCWPANRALPSLRLTPCIRSTPSAWEPETPSAHPQSCSLARSLSFLPTTQAHLL
jgi:hypothetical protein